MKSTGNVNGTGNVNVNGTGNSEYESVGLFYGGFVMIGMAIGAFTGFMIGGGQEEFLKGGWIDSMIGVATGLFIGVGAGLIYHGIFVSKKSRQ